MLKGSLSEQQGCPLAIESVVCCVQYKAQSGIVSAIEQ